MYNDVDNDKIERRLNRILLAYRRTGMCKELLKIIRDNGCLLLYDDSSELFLLDKNTRVLSILGFDGFLITSFYVSQEFLRKLEDEKLDVKCVYYSLHEPYEIYYYDREKNAHLVEILEFRLDTDI